MGELTALVGDGARVAVSANALDSGGERSTWLRREMDCLAAAGLDPFEIDLRRVDGELDADLFWATGGNAFVLREALAKSGFDRLLAARVRSGALAYGGSSAGACVAGSTLAGIELIDDPGERPIFDGLGFVDYAIAPHAGTSEDIARLIGRWERTGTPYRALRDGEAITVHDGVTAHIDCYRA